MTNPRHLLSISQSTRERMERDYWRSKVKPGPLVYIDAQDYVERVMRTNSLINPMPQQGDKVEVKYMRGVTHEGKVR
mgnify:CR=1 FL=1